MLNYILPLSVPLHSLAAALPLFAITVHPSIHPSREAAFASEFCRPRDSAARGNTRSIFSAAAEGEREGGKGE